MQIPPLPTTAQVRQALLLLRNPQLEKLAKLSGVPHGTIWKIRGERLNERLEALHSVQSRVL